MRRVTTRSARHAGYRNKPSGFSEMRASAQQARVGGSTRRVDVKLDAFAIRKYSFRFLFVNKNNSSFPSHKSAQVMNATSCNATRRVRAPGVAEHRVLKIKDLAKRALNCSPSNFGAIEGVGGEWRVVLAPRRSATALTLAWLTRQHSRFVTVTSNYIIINTLRAMPYIRLSITGRQVPLRPMTRVPFLKMRR